MKTPGFLRDTLLNLVSDFDMIVFVDDIRAEELCKRYAEFDILTSKSFDDLRHISYAIINDCDIIVSWNFKHFVNQNTINKLMKANKFMGLSYIEIISPGTFMERINHGNGLDDYSS